MVELAAMLYTFVKVDAVVAALNTKYGFGIPDIDV